MKTGVIDVGGGFRGIYAVGVFDYCIDQEICFDLGIGISAGSAARRYNEGVARAQEYAKQGRVLIIAPDDTCGVDTLRRDKDALRKLYQKGYHDVQRIAAFIKDFESE